jgi:hypothetical protein
VTGWNWGAVVLVGERERERERLGFLGIRGKENFGLILVNLGFVAFSYSRSFSCLVSGYQNLLFWLWRYTKGSESSSSTWYLGAFFFFFPTVEHEQDSIGVYRQGTAKTGTKHRNKHKHEHEHEHEHKYRLPWAIIGGLWSKSGGFIRK